MNRHARAMGVLGAVSMVFACKTPSGQGSEQGRASPGISSSSPTSLSPAPEPPRLLPLKGPRSRELSALGRVATLYLPVGSTQPRPLALLFADASHRNRELCQWWSRDLAQRGFLLCVPQASTRGETAEELQQSDYHALRAFLKRVKQIHGAHLSGGSVLLIAEADLRFAAQLTRQEPAFFSYLLLWGATADDGWSSSAATLFGSRGGKAMAIVCADEPCAQAMRYPKSWVERAGARARVFRKEKDQQGVALDALGWLIGDEPRWKRLPKGRAP